MQPSRLVLPILVCLAMAGSAHAIEYVVDLPQLVGTHGMNPYTVVDVSQTLPISFSTITSGSLRLTGEQFPGSVTNMITGATGPIGALLQLEDAPPALPFPPFPYFEYQLASGLHEFQLDIPIVAPYQDTPDFANWLNGTAHFAFSVGGPAITADSYSANALVRIDQARLILNAQPVPEPTTFCASILTLALLGGLSVLQRPKRSGSLTTAECD